MGAKLLFESRLISHVLGQEGPEENEPVMTLRLEMTDGPIIYVSGGAAIKASAWRMKIRRARARDTEAPRSGATIRYVATEGKPYCVVELSQSPERFTALLGMFMGGHSSEITVVVDELADKADYSKDWNSLDRPSLAIDSISFEFHLPLHEG